MMNRTTSPWNGRVPSTPKAQHTANEDRPVRAGLCLTGPDGQPAPQGSCKWRVSQAQGQKEMGRAKSMRPWEHETALCASLPCLPLAASVETGQG
jgi:hypothetical protein